MNDSYTENGRFGTSFETDSNAYSLSSVTLRMDHPTAGTASEIVSIYDSTGTGGAEGNLLGVLTNPAPIAVSNNMANYTFTASGIQLNANTVYWVTLEQSNGDGNFDWPAHLWTTRLSPVLTLRSTSRRRTPTRTRPHGRANTTFT